MTKMKIIVGVIVLIAVAGGGVAIFKKGKNGSLYETARVLRKDIREEVIATGSVLPRKTINLQFENTGTVRRIAVDVGDEVKQGTVLAALDIKDLEARVLQDEAALAQAQAKLAIAREGSRPEDIAIAKTTLVNAEVALLDAKANLDAVTKKADADLADAYEDGRIAFLNNLLTLGNIREDVRSIYLSPPDKFSQSDTQAKNSFGPEYLATDAVYTKARERLVVMSGAPSRSEIELALDDLASSASQMSKMLDLTNRALGATDNPPATTKTTIATDITNNKTLLTAVTDARSALESTAATNAVTVNTATTTYNTALANVASAKDKLALAEAGSRPSEIKQYEAASAQARATLAVSKSQLEKSQIISPIDGVVSDIAVEIGETARQGGVAVTLLTKGAFHVEVNIPEVDVPRVRDGAEADVTLDAFGPERHFPAKVSSIDPAENQVEGVVYYKATIVFNNETQNLRSGMTANVTIMGWEAKNALVIPQRAVGDRGSTSLTTGGSTSLDSVRDRSLPSGILPSASLGTGGTGTTGDRKIVRVLGGGMPQERTVTLGIRGAKGEVEVLSGLAEGEEVIVFEKKK